MNLEEIKALAAVFEKVPGAKGIDIKDVRRLVELLRESPEVGSIELKGWFGTGVVLTRTQIGYPVPSGMAMMPMPAPAPPAAVASEPARSAPPLKEIKSPMVGTFYAAPEPGSEPYIKAGARVSPGRTVCIIEAMKIMNPIECDRAGTVVAVLVENGHPVEFEQPLFVIN